MIPDRLRPPAPLARPRGPARLTAWRPDGGPEWTVA